MFWIQNVLLIQSTSYYCVENFVEELGSYTPQNIPRTTEEFYIVVCNFRYPNLIPTPKNP